LCDGGGDVWRMPRLRERISWGWKTGQSTGYGPPDIPKRKEKKKSAGVVQSKEEEVLKWDTAPFKEVMQRATSR
jgi:hypothetical protein